jgi:hypothetical protein
MSIAPHASPPSAHGFCDVQTRTEERFREVYQRVADTLEVMNFCGADPFDGLNSRFFAAMPFAEVRLARLAWLQLLKRLPFDIRRIAGVPPTANPVTLALAARTYAQVGQEEKGRRALRRLLAMRCDTTRWGRGAWGYPFAWQSKAFYIPRGTPNIIATAYATRAVAECAQWIEEDVDPIVADAAAFVAGVLTRESRTGATYLGYGPECSTMVHNANLWGAYVLALAASHGGPRRWRLLAEDAIGYTARAQQHDGGWPYGEAKHHLWTDGFHTGYVLEALHLCRSLLNLEGLAAPINRGIGYYLDTFLRADGIVPYYAGGGGPLDANNFAQMAITLEAVRPRPDWPALIDRVIGAAISHLWCSDLGAFAYQRTRNRMVRIVYPRWTQIWMMHALALRLDQGRKQPE